jgi:hypothetical protein
LLLHDVYMVSQHLHRTHMAAMMYWHELQPLNSSHTQGMPAQVIMRRQPTAADNNAVFNHDA